MPPTSAQPNTPQPKKVLKKVLFVFFIGLAVFLGLPLLLLIGGAVYFMTFYSAQPVVNEGQEKTEIQALLRERYGKDFTVENIQTKARKYLGDNQSISAEAYPDDDKTAKIKLYKTLDIGSKYSDSYLTLVWSREIKQSTKPFMDSLYGTTQEYALGVSPDVVYNREYALGRVISLEEAVKTVPEKLEYNFKIDAGQQGTREEHSTKFFAIKRHLDERYQSPNSRIWYDFSQGEEAYRCFLPGFRRQFVESDRQLWGCWYRSDKNAPSPVPAKRTATGGIDMTKEAIPIEVPAWANVTYAKVTDATAADMGSYVASYEDLPVRIDVQKGGFGDAINNAKKQYVSHSIDAVPLAIGATPLVLSPDQSVSVGGIVYRRDAAPEYRQIHYVLAYKTFTVHVSAVTRQPGYDARDKEFWLYNFVGQFDPVDGFKET